MLRPSYSDLMEALTEQDNIDLNIASRYTIVIAAARRARMLVDNATPFIPGNPDKSVTLAVKELFEGYIKITAGNPVEYERHVYETRSIDSFEDLDEMS